MSRQWEGLLPDMNHEFLSLTLEKRAATTEEAERLQLLKKKSGENCQTILRGLAAVGASLAESNQELTDGELGSMGYLIQYLAHLGADLAYLESYAAECLPVRAETEAPNA